jgi:hypothetical protein
MEMMLQKIKDHEPIDQLDWTHPEFCQWRSAAELTIHQYPSPATDSYHQKFDQICKVKMPQRSLLL